MPSRLRMSGVRKSFGATRALRGVSFEVGPGEVTSLPSGHDAYVVGEDPVVMVDFFGAMHYAKAR